MHVATQGGSTVPSFERKSTGFETKSSQVNQINTLQDLQRAELQGASVSIGETHLIKKIDSVLKALEGPNTTFEMSVHEQLNTVIIKVLNKDTGELIREIPPEKTLDLVARFMEINGILVDKKV